MGQVIFRCVLIVAVLILIFGVGTRVFSYALTDAYNTLIGNGWTVKDALGFLGTSIAGTIAMNPSLAPTVAAGALSAYIVAKGAQLYDIYREWRNLRTGIAILNPVEYSERMSTKELRSGEYGWSEITYYHWPASGGRWQVYVKYVEYYNSGGVLQMRIPLERGDYRSSPGDVIGYINSWNLGGINDQEGLTMLRAVLQTAYGYVLANTQYYVTYTRTVVPVLNVGSPGVNASRLGYRVNVDPQNISEDGVQYLSDPDAFYNWFLTNYMNGTNEGSFVTPLDDAYDEIRTQLQTIIDQLNTLIASGGGGVSEDALNEMKTEILNAMNTQFSAVDTQLSGIDSKLSSLDATLTGVSNSLNGLQTDVTGVKTSIDTLSTGLESTLTSLGSDIASVKTSIDTLNTDINEGQQQQQGFWERLFEWLDVTVWQKLQELLEKLFVPSQEQLDELINIIQLADYEKNFSADVSFTPESVSIPISLFGTTVYLSEYIDDYASELKPFMNIFVSGIAALFVIGAFRVYFHID